VATTLTRHGRKEIRSVGFIERDNSSEIPGWNAALDRLVRELVCAFFIAMAVMWVVTTVAGIFA
jgi:hypothetical protein